MWPHDYVLTIGIVWKCCVAASEKLPWKITGVCPLASLSLSLSGCLSALPAWMMKIQATLQGWQSSELEGPWAPYGLCGAKLSYQPGLFNFI